MDIRGAYGYDVDAVSAENGLDCSIVIDGEEVRRTKQSFAEEADINTLVRKFHLTGELPQNVAMPMHGDFTDADDFRAAMNKVVAAREAFDEMPAEIRARFHNDPAEFVDFCSDEKNWPEAEKLGLLTPEAVARRAAEAAEKRKEDEAAIIARYKKDEAAAVAKPTPA